MDGDGVTVTNFAGAERRVEPTNDGKRIENEGKTRYI